MASILLISRSIYRARRLPSLMTWRQTSSRSDHLSGARSASVVSSSINVLDLNRYGYGRFTWWLHTHKANIVFMLLLISIIVVMWLIGSSMAVEQCTSNKTMLGVLFGIDVLLILIAYTCVWPHTQWRSRSVNASQFTGSNAISRQQLFAAPQMQTKLYSPSQSEPIVQSMIMPANGLAQAEPMNKSKLMAAPGQAFNYIQSLKGYKADQMWHPDNGSSSTSKPSPVRIPQTQHLIPPKVHQPVDYLTGGPTPSHITQPMRQSIYNQTQPAGHPVDYLTGGPTSTVVANPTEPSRAEKLNYFIDNFIPNSDIVAKRTSWAPTGLPPVQPKEEPVVGPIPQSAFNWLWGNEQTPEQKYEPVDWLLGRDQSPEQKNGTVYSL